MKAIRDEIRLMAFSGSFQDYEYLVVRPGVASGFFESIIAARAINTRPAVSLTFYVERNAIDDRVTCH